MTMQSRDWVRQILSALTWLFPPGQPDWQPQPTRPGGRHRATVRRPAWQPPNSGKEGS